jgi:hypothetical protein
MAPQVTAWRGVSRVAGLRWSLSDLGKPKLRQEVNALLCCLDAGLWKGGAKMSDNIIDDWIKAIARDQGKGKTHTERFWIEQKLRLKLSGAFLAILVALALLLALLSGVSPLLSLPLSLAHSVPQSTADLRDLILVLAISVGIAHLVMRVFEEAWRYATGR